jgi:hypothetical protein
VPARAAAHLDFDQSAAPAADAEVACLAACGPGLSASARIAIVTTRPVIADWLAEGCDLAADILPTLADRTSQKRANPIRTWAYFTPAIAKRHDLRLALAARAKSPGETNAVPKCSIPDDHISPRRSALFMARSVLRELRDGAQPC